MAKPPHLPPLPPEYEKKPASIHHLYNEFGYIDISRHDFYRVIDGDTLENIAARVGVTGKYLLKECFGTTDPAEVNWYLRNKIGCKEYGPQRRNFAFSTSADPGKLCLPLNLLNKLSKKIYYPPARNFDLVPELPRYKQDNDNGCWGAALANIYDWGKGHPSTRTVVDALEEIDPEFAQRYRDEKYITGPDAKLVFRKAHLRKLNFRKFTQHYDDVFAIEPSLIVELMQFIEHNTPFILLQKAHGLWTHWIVVNGYKWSSSHELRFRYFDPGDKTVYTEPAEDVLKKCYDAPTAFPKAYG